MSHEHERASRNEQPGNLRDFPVTSGWNAFDVWWTRVRVRWVPTEAEVIVTAASPRGDAPADR